MKIAKVFETLPGATLLCEIVHALHCFALAFTKVLCNLGRHFNFRQTVLHQTAAFAIIRQARRLLPQRR